MLLRVFWTLTFEANISNLGTTPGPVVRMRKGAAHCDCFSLNK